MVVVGPPGLTHHLNQKLIGGRLMVMMLGQKQKGRKNLFGGNDGISFYR